MRFRSLSRLIRLALGISYPLTHATAEEYEQFKWAEKSYTVCRVNLDKEKLELFSKDDHGVPFKTFAALDKWLGERGRKLTFAMNAGMYHWNFSPVGLYVENGRELVPLNLQDADGNFFLKPNGVFAVTQNGAQVTESLKFAGAKVKPILATQSGPMLVIDGNIHPKFDPSSKSLHTRNGVGVVSPKEVVFVISKKPVTLYEFAALFRDRLHCKNALYLDGSVSSLFSEKLEQSDRKMDLGTFIGITAPLK